MNAFLVAPLEFGIVCTELPAMVRFYGSAFLFDVVGRTSVPAEIARRTPLSSEAYEVVRLQSPFGERLKLLRQEPPPPVRKRAFGETILDRVNGTFLTLLVEDIEEAMDRVIGGGGTASSEAVVLREGLSVAFAHDPEGNWVELAHYDDLAGYRGDEHYRPTSIRTAASRR